MRHFLSSFVVLYKGHGVECFDDWLVNWLLSLRKPWFFCDWVRGVPHRFLPRSTPSLIIFSIWRLWSLGALMIEWVWENHGSFMIEELEESHTVFFLPIIFSITPYYFLYSLHYLALELALATFPLVSFAPNLILLCFTTSTPFSSLLSHRVLTCWPYCTIYCIIVLNAF